MAAEIISHDFGKKDRDFVRRLSRLSGLWQDHVDDVMRNPIPHLQAASKVVCELKDQIERARLASYNQIVITDYDDFVPPPYLSTINVSKDEWDRLQEMKRIIFEGA